MNPSVIIDVRSPQEFERGHLDGAVNIPVDQLQQTIGSIEGLERSSEILVYCQSGMRSAVACSILAQQGFGRVSNGGSMATLLMNFKGAIR